MSTHYEIIVESESPSKKHFYFFQQPAVYEGGENPYTNSLADGVLLPDADKDQLVFTLEQQYYAGAQNVTKLPTVGDAMVGKLSRVPIDLTLASGVETKNSTKLTIEDDTVHLKEPVYNSGVQEGAFRIDIPEFEPSANNYLVGLGAADEEGKIILSSFIKADSNTNVDVKPILKFYVATGDYTKGKVVDFTQSSKKSALCDATHGKLSFKVTYTRLGEWKVE